LCTCPVEDSDGLGRCPVCRRAESPFGRAVADGSCDGGLHLLKYNGVRLAAGVLGRLLAEAIAALEPAFGQATVLVIPVPLFKTKRRQRGFSQAELISQAAMTFHPAAERLQLRTDILVRTRDTHSKIGLTSPRRRENMHGAFAVARAAEVTGRQVVLVDDVYTTGTTLSECARRLRRAGARQVWVATVARRLKLASKYAEIETDEAEAAEVEETRAAGRQQGGSGAS
jgi:ComF family protein